MLSLMQPANQHNKACLCYYKLLKFHNKPILCISLHVNPLSYNFSMHYFKQLNTNELKRKQSVLK